MTAYTSQRASAFIAKACLGVSQRSRTTRSTRFIARVLGTCRITAAHCNGSGHVPECKNGGVPQEKIDEISKMEGIEVEYDSVHRTKSEWIEDAANHFMVHYAGKQLKIGQTGCTLHIPSSRNKAKQTTYNINTQKQNAAFKKFEDVVSKAIHIRSEAASDKHGQSKTKSARVAKTATFETFGALVVINGEKNLVWFNAQTKEVGATDVLLYEFGSRKI